jgi:hypothetical protein
MKEPVIGKEYEWHGWNVMIIDHEVNTYKSRNTDTNEMEEKSYWSVRVKRIDKGAEPSEMNTPWSVGFREH